MKVVMRNNIDPSVEDCVVGMRRRKKETTATSDKDER